MNKKELIKKFLANKCSEDENAFVQEILVSEPYLLDKLLNQEDWDAVEINTVKDDENLKAEIWEQIYVKTKRKISYRRLFKKMAVAASILIIVTLGLRFGETGIFSPSQLTSVISHSDSSIQTVQNKGDYIQEYKLADGSIITLHAHSSLQYSSNFKANRTISLISGKAAFDVAKDPHHPFTVFSGNITTTALGTKFTVGISHEKINVQLHEGKVVVKKIERNTILQPAFLSAGEQCIISAKMDNIIITSLHNEQLNSLMSDSKKTDVPGFGNSLKFYNVPLTEAFDMVGKYFNTHITYEIKDVEKKYFTGRFTGTDSLSSILNTLTAVNGLKLQHHDGGIKITHSDNAGFKSSIKNANTNDKQEPAAGNKAVKVSEALPKPMVLKYGNAALEQVFSDMEKAFGIDIQYEKSDVAGKFFTGLVSSRDNPKKILYIICKMNQLRISEHSQGYRVMK